MNNLFPNVKQAMDKFKASPFNKSEAKPVNRHQPGAVVVWKSWLDRDRWLFLARTGISIQDWRNAHFELHQQYPAHVAPPETYILNFAGQLNDMQYVDLKADKREECLICHGQGIAYILRGLLILNNIPQPLRTILCRCKPAIYRATKKQNEPESWDR
jgi:hypothetical protein